MNIVNVGYDSTNYYVIGPDGNRLLVDVGFPRTLPKLVAMLRRKGIGLEEIRHLLVTHYHPDHAGLAQEVMNQGVRLIVLEPQVPGIPLLKSYLKPRDQYVEIRIEDAIRVAPHESRAFLKSIGFAGEIISTPGHSDDSVTLVLDQGAAFTGDLPGPQWATEEAREAVLPSWEAIRALNATTIYPGHGPALPVVRTANDER